MKIISKLIDDICNVIIKDVKDRENMHIAVRQCEYAGFVGINELRQISERGLPIVDVYSTILRISKQEGLQKIKNREMSYHDLICVIAIIAQDLMESSRKL